MGMLSARLGLRRATASLLRRHTNANSPRPHLLTLPAPQIAATRRFSHHEDIFLGRVKNSLSDVRATARIVTQDWAGVDLTDDEASKLLDSFAQKKRVDDVLKLLQYCQKNNLDTWSTARTKAFRTLFNAGELQPALQVFDSLIKDKVDMKPWLVGRALHAAHKSKRTEELSRICRQFVSKTFVVENSDNGVQGMLRALKESEDEMDELALESLAAYAHQAGEPELALEVFDRTKASGVDVTVQVYGSVIRACGKAERWKELLEVYEQIPEQERSKLYGDVLSFVVRAHTRSESDELVARGVDIFTRHDKGKWDVLPCDAALEALLQSRQLDQLLDLAGEMRRHGVKWSSFTCKMVTLAYIESGSAEKAKQMLLVNAPRLEDGGVESYRELIAHYTKTDGARDACQLYADMMQNSTQLETSDWCQALELARGLPYRSMYSRFRKQLRLQNRTGEASIPSRLLLPVVEALDEDKVSLRQAEPIREGTPTVTSMVSPPQQAGKAGGELTEQQASSLLGEAARGKRVDECLELLRHRRELGLTFDTPSLSSAFRTLCDAEKHEAALQLFDVLCAREGPELAPWMNGRALDSATRLQRTELVGFIFQRLLWNAKTFKPLEVEATAEGVHAMMRDARERGVKVTKSGLRSLAIFADRSGQLELVLDILSIMESAGMEVTLDVYGAALYLLGESKRWEDVLKVYESMPEHRRSKLSYESLRWVTTAKRIVAEQESLDGTRDNREPSQMPSDVSLARTSFDDIVKSGGVGLTRNEASTLLQTMAKHKRVADCVEMLRYFESQRVTPKPLVVVAAFAVCCNAKEFDAALEAFETVYKSDCVLDPWVFGYAMNAAKKLDRHQSVVSIFRRLLSYGGKAPPMMPALLESRSSRSRKDEAGPERARKDGVHELLLGARDRGVRISAFALQALATFAELACQPDMALEVLSMMRDESVAVPCKVYQSALTAYGRSGRWSDVLSAFEAMPEQFHPQLTFALGSVIRAHTRSGEDDLVIRGLELFEEHPSKWGSFACNAALEALAQTSQFDELFALADDMKRQRVEWSSYTHKLVILAHIRSGSIDKALRLLRDNSKLAPRGAAACYRELVDFYANTRGDHLEALQLSLEMMENAGHLQFSDWCKALELALELPDNTMYWKVRKHLWLLRDEPFDDKIPSHLLLRERASPRTEALLRDGSLAITLDIPLVQAELSLAQEVFDEICDSGGVGLTTNVATKLLATMAKYKQTEECSKMMAYFQEHKVLPKPSPSSRPC